MRKTKNISYKLLAALLIAMLLPTAAYAVGTGSIDLEHACSVTLHYADDKAPSPVGMKFSLYRVADTAFNGDMSLCGDFADPEKYPVSLDCETTSDWLDLAKTLKGYVQKNAPAAAKTGKTDSEGSVGFEDLKPGMYLVLGDPIEYRNYSYTATPFLLFLPEEDPRTHAWNYDADVVVKHDPPEYEPPDEPDEPGETTVTRKVLKEWNDKGKADARPEEITVELLRDGKVYNTVTLNAKNNWRHTWTDLKKKHEWSLVETAVAGYTTVITQDGITFKVTNTPREPRPDEPYVPAAIPVVKVITGDVPAAASDFTFTMTAKNSGNPMPAGSLDGTKELTITGPGRAEFGTVYFTEPGTYEYEVREKNGGIKGYTYDTTVYTVRFTVTEETGNLLACRCTIVKPDGTQTDAAWFNNPYKVPPVNPPVLPQTGLLWWPVPAMLCAGLMSILVGLMLRKRQG